MEKDRTEYCKTCRQLAWGYLQVDGPRSVYYAKRAIEVGRISLDQRSIYDASILIGQTFWAKEQYDSARVYYNQASAALDETIEELRPAENSTASEIRLSKREKQVAKLLAEGKTTHQIAEQLFLGDETIIWYRKRLYAKFNVHTIAEFSAELVRRGLVE